MSFSEALVLNGISGRSRTRRSSSLRPEQALQQTVERRVAGSAIEDAIELRVQGVRLFRLGASL